MKKLVLFLIVLFACNGIAEAQTYYYKLTSKVHPDTGVKRPYSDEIYITFTNNKNVFYESDKEGNKKIATVQNLVKTGRPAKPDIHL